MKIVYLDCFSGISGDMTLAALVDAGADREYIESELAKIKLEPFTLQWKRVDKRGISALKMDVVLDPAAMPMHHRHYADIAAMIERAGFRDNVVALSQAIFERIGEAEAKIHNIPVEKVHFHEVGAIDSIVDVIGVALALDSLQVERIYCSPVPLGSGTVLCDHGLYPVPAPATLEMMRGLPIAPCRHRKEMTTPTGAGIVSGAVDEFSDGLPAMVVETIGYGAGTRDLPDQPNVLRAVVGCIDPRQAANQHTSLPHHGHAHAHSHDDHDHEPEHVHKPEPRRVRFRVLDHSHGHDRHRHHHDHSHDHEHHDDDHKHTPGELHHHSSVDHDDKQKDDHKLSRGQTDSGDCANRQGQPPAAH